MVARGTDVVVRGTVSRRSGAQTSRDRRDGTRSLAGRTLGPGAALQGQIPISQSSNDAMKGKVGEEGVTVPKDLLGDVDEVEVRNENGRIVVEPVRQSGEEGEDPNLGLGRDLVSCGPPDASESPSRHLYDR